MWGVEDMRRLIPLSILVGLLALLVVIPVSAGGPAGDPPGLARAIAAQEAHTDALMAKEGVVGTAVGLGEDGKPVILILTEASGVAGLPRSLDGVQVVVKVTGKIFALHHQLGHCGGPPSQRPAECDNGGDGDPPPPAAACSTTERCPRPVPIGVSTGHPSITAGTIGARVTDGTNVFALSNNHVYAASNSATIGDNVLQPGAYDGGQDPADAIGTLSAFETIVFSTSASNVIDAAIALSSTANL